MLRFLLGSFLGLSSLSCYAGCSENPIASDNTPLPLCQIEQTFMYNESAQVTNIVVQYPNIVSGDITTYVQTFTYSGSELDTISGWVAG